MSSIQGLLFEPVPILVDSIVGSVVDTAGVTSITIPAHEDGDLILAFGSNRTNTASPTPAGYTSIATGIANPVGTGSDRSVNMVYKFSDGSAQTLTFDGGSATASTVAYSGCLIFRRAVGVDGGSGISSNSTGATLAVPALTLTRPPSIVVAFSFYCGASIGITAAPAGWTVDNGMAYAEYLTDWAGGNFTLDATAALIGAVVEIY
jgi:hypothetical protein